MYLYTLCCLHFADSISSRSISIDTNNSFSKCTPSSPEQQFSDYCFRKFCSLPLSCSSWSPGIGYILYFGVLVLYLNYQVKDCTISLQIVQLTAAGNFEEALSLCKLLPPEDSNLRAAKEGSIHIRFIAILDYSC